VATDEPHIGQTAMCRRARVVTAPYHLQVVISGMFVPRVWPLSITSGRAVKIADLLRRSATYVHRTLKGARPGRTANQVRSAGAGERLN